MPVDAPSAPSQIKNTTWDQFFEGLRGLARESGREKSMARVLGELNEAASSPQVSDAAFQEHVEGLLQTHASELGVKSEDREKILEDAVAWRRKSYPIMSSESFQEPLPQSGFSSSKREPSPSHGGGVTTIAETANGALKEKIQGSVQQEFAKLLATTRPDDLPGAIEQFYHTHLSAAGIVGSQYQVLIDQSKKLYGGKEEFDKHADALENARKETVAPLEEVHQIGPIRPGKTEADSKALYRQRDLERTNIRNLQMIAQTQPKNLTRAMNQVFDAEWARREDDAVMDQFLKELKAYDYSHRTIYEDFVAPVVAVTTAAQLYEQEQGTTEVTQGQTFSNASSGGSGVGRNLGQRATNLAKDQLKKRLRRKAEEELAEQAVKQGALTALRSGFSALISAIGGWPVVLAIAIIVLVAVIVIVILVSIAGGNSNNQQNGTPIPGLTMNISYPQSVQNGQNIPYTIDIMYTGTDSITITDNIPANANDIPQSITGTSHSNGGAVIWVLDSNTPQPDSTTGNKHYQFKITLQPTQKDVQVTNVIAATYTNGGPSGNGGGGGPTAGGYCSPSNLAQYFGGAQNGKIASCICKYESGGDPGAANKACLRGGTADYSIGLFQINLIAHCSGALTMHGNYCSVADARQLSRCTQSMMDPVNNINEAVAIFHGANGFAGPWAAEKGKCF